MQGFHLDAGGLRYATDELPARSTSKTVLAVSLAPAKTEAELGSESSSAAGPADAADTRLVDSVDLFSFRSRRRFAELVAAQFGREPDAVLGQLALLVDAIERARVQAECPGPVELTPERKRVAASLLRRKGLLDLAAGAMDALGFVGEESVKRLAYLVVTSRLLERPLSARRPAAASPSCSRC